MKQLPPALESHLTSGATTLCWCWRVTRQDGGVLGFTDHDRDLAFDGALFEAASGFTATEIATSLGLAVDTLEAQGALSAASITEADLRAGRYDDATVEIFRVNWADTDQQVLMFKGSVGEVRRGELAFTAELRGLAHRLNQDVGRVYARPCDAVLGDARCGVDLDDPAFKGEGTVTGVSDNRVIAATGLGSFDGGWFAGGRLDWASGANAGLAAEVKAHAASSGGAVLSLWEPAAFPVAEGDQFDIRAGCDKSLATCRDRFDNVENHRGFPHMPGNDRAFSYAVPDDGTHDGRSFFN